MQRKNAKKQGTTGSRRAARRPVQIASSSSRMGYAPVAMSRGVGSKRIPQIASSGTTTRITHSEFFASVVSTGTGYAVSSYPCNPGVASMFPWLSQVAARYETYKFKRVQFEYHTRAATSQVGTVGMVFDFDAADAAPASQMLALSYQDKSADSPWKDQCFVLDLAQGDRYPTRYTRVGSITTQTDIKTYDIGNLHVFVDGVAASTNLGLLEVKYVVELYTPQLQNPVGGIFTGGTGMSGAALFGTVWTPDAQAIAAFETPSASVLTFNQAWEGILTFYIVGTGLGADLAPGVAGGSAAVLGQTVNAAATNVRGYIRVSAVPGTSLTPTMTATTVTASTWALASGAYDSYGA